MEFSYEHDDVRYVVTAQYESGDPSVGIWPGYAIVRVVDPETERAWEDEALEAKFDEATRIKMGEAAAVLVEESVQRSETAVDYEDEED